MAKYSDIKGFTVQTLSSDPAASVADTGSWASVASLNTARNDLAVSMAGTTEAALVAGGYSGGIVANVELWDGSSWTETTDIPTATYAHGGTGTSSTAALIFGGQTPGSPYINATYEWDGSSWTSGGNLNSAQRYRRGAGSQTAGLAAAGNGGSPPLTGETEQYNGSSWTEVNDMNSARTAGSMGGGASPYTAAIYFGGYTVPDKGALTESCNGSSWTEVGDLNTARQYVCGSGTSTDGLAFGGGVIPPITTNTEAWDGSSWTEVANMGTSRYGSTGTGASSANALVAGGNTPSASSAVEEWTTTATPTTLAKITEGQLFFNSTTNTFKETITDIPGATWSSGGNLNTGRKWGGQGVLGIQTATLLCGGATAPANQTNTEQYNGTSWTEVNDLNAANSASMCWGTTTSAINCGGATPRKQVESWDGSSWTETTEFNNPRYGGLGAGSSNTSGIIFGGENPSPGGPHPGPYFSATEVWDGSSWTEVNEMNQARYGMLGGGAIYTAAIGAGGADPVPSYGAITEIWDGTSWTEVSDMNEKRMTGVGFGITTSLIATGSDP